MHSIIDYNGAYADLLAQRFGMAARHTGLDPPLADLDYAQFRCPKGTGQLSNFGIVGTWSTRVSPSKEKQESTGPGYRCMAERPDHFVPRHQMDRIVDALCRAAASDADSSMVGITTALHGAGGFGKTTLAQQICFDERVRQAYPDGILWITLGEQVSEADRLRLVTMLLHQWTRESPAVVNDVNMAAIALRKCLEGKRMLVVVDDLWSRVDLAPFSKLGPGITVLVTTRDKHTLPDRCNQIAVDAMKPSESVVLLADGLEGIAPAALARMAERLGHWPLLLKLVNRELHELAQEHSPAVAITEIERTLDVAGVAGFDIGNADERNRAVCATIEVSLRRLEREPAFGNQSARQLYERMAVFPEDTDIPLKVLAQYWGVSEREAFKLCRRLDALSLLWRFDRSQSTARLHDVFRQYLRDVHGKGVVALHQQLLNALRPASGKWWDLADDAPYAWRHVAYHLREAGQAEELGHLVWELGWLAGKLRTCGPAALIADFAYVREDADTQWLQDALVLSSHVLMQNTCELPSQLTGRLLGFAERSPRIDNLLDRFRREWAAPWLCPLTPSFTPPGGSLIRTLVGHSSTVSGVVVMADGKRAISCSWDGTLKVWHLDSGAELATLSGHSGSVSAVAVTADGTRAISASNDKTLKVWDLDSGTELATLSGHSHSVSAVAVTADGRYAISASYDKTLKVWDLASNTELATLSGHSNSVTAVAVTADGRYAISGSWDSTLKVWDLDSGTELATLSGHSESVSAVAVTADGTRAISASYGNTLKVWDLDSGTELATLSGHSNSVAAVTITADGKRAISASWDRTLRVWALDSGAQLATLFGHSHTVFGVAVTADGKRAISASEDETLKVWDLDSGAQLAMLSGHSGWVNGIAVTRDGKRAISASDDHTLKVWDLDSGAQLATLSGHSSSVFAVAATADGKRAISASGDETLKVWHLDSEVELATLSSGHLAPILAVAVTADGKRAISASDDNTLKVWDLEMGVEVASLSGHSRSVNAVGVTVDGKRAISASDDNTLKVWNLITGAELATLSGHSRSVTAVAVMADGKRAISASADNTLKVWDLNTGAELATLSGHSSEVTAVAVTADSKRAISGSWDSTLKVWDLDSGQAVVSLTGEAPMFACAAHPAGLHRVIAGDTLGRMYFFKLIESREAGKNAFTILQTSIDTRQDTAAPSMKELRQRLETEFSAHELELLIADAFPEVGRLDNIVAAVHPHPQRVNELVMYCQRRGWLDRLAAAIIAARGPAR